MLVVAGWKWPLCPDSTKGIYVLTCMITCIPGTWHHARRRHATMLLREFLSSGRFKEASCDVSSLFVACINAAVSRASWSLHASSCTLFSSIHTPGMAFAYKTQPGRTRLMPRKKACLFWSYPSSSVVQDQHSTRAGTMQE